MGFLTQTLIIEQKGTAKAFSLPAAMVTLQANQNA
jgi:hypothetical protein